MIGFKKAEITDEYRVKGCKPYKMKGSMGKCKPKLWRGIFSFFIMIRKNNDLEGKGMPLLEVKHLKKVYTTRFGGNPVQALSNVSFSVEQGEFVAIMGESGSGKTTLLNIIAAFDKPTDGEVLLNGKSIHSIKESEIAAFRREHLGFVFQDFNLLDTFSIQDNIFLPLVLAGNSFEEMNRELIPIARKLGINDILMKFPYEVSGGQKQRAAIARARLLASDYFVMNPPG